MQTKPSQAAQATKKNAGASAAPSGRKGANPQQVLAMKCSHLREYARTTAPRKREDLQAEMRNLGCAYPVDGAVEKEQACAAAVTGQQISEACGTRRR